MTTTTPRTIVPIFAPMPRDHSQTGIVDQLLLSGLLSCFRGKQQSIRVSDVIDRKYTSAESLSRLYLSRLFQSKMIDIDASVGVEDLLLDPWSIDQSIKVEIQNIPRIEYNLRMFDLISDIKNELINDLSKLDVLLQILMELLAAECAEYANFYCNKERIALDVYQPGDARLLLLLQSMSQGQIFMLIWRAVKNSAKSCKDDSTRLVHFEDIVELAHEYSIQYGQLDIAVENYNRPKIFKPSRLIKILLHDILEVTSDHISFAGMEDYILASKLLQTDIL